eukprot:TRINITY_DN1409_c0_g2_i1.p1 TRINITY_DN1409_c0_g2~~TRINITY_DN1409_c0_g2_i1.p1  ORF type:complete len:488 (+),score=113.46 TRINITY_DN1409_c0_g2_i1:107-1570(+)
MAQVTTNSTPVTEDSNGNHFTHTTSGNFLLLQRKDSPTKLRSSGDKTATINSNGSVGETADAPEQQPISIDNTIIQENTIIDASDPPPQSLHMPLAPVKKEDVKKSEPTTPAALLDHHDEHPAPETLHKPLEPVKSVRSVDALIDLTNTTTPHHVGRSRSSTTPVPYTPTLEVALGNSPPIAIKSQLYTPNQNDQNRIENGTESTESTTVHSDTPRGLTRSRPIRVIPSAPIDPSDRNYAGMNSASLNKVDLLLHTRNQHPLLNAHSTTPYSSSFTDFSSLIPQNRQQLPITKGSSTPQVRQFPYEGVACSPTPEALLNGVVNSENVKSLIEWKRNHPTTQSMSQINTATTPDLHSDRVCQSNPISATPSPMLLADRRVVSQSANNSPHEPVHPINDELQRRRAAAATPTVQPSPPTVKLSAWAQQQQLELWQREWKLTKSRSVGTDGVGLVNGANVSNTEKAWTQYSDEQLQRQYPHVVIFQQVDS